MNLLMVIFGLIGIFAAVGTVQAFKERNVLSILFNFGAAVFSEALQLRQSFFKGTHLTLITIKKHPLC